MDKTRSPSLKQHVVMHSGTEKMSLTQCHSRLHSLAVTGHVHIQVVRVVQHLGSKQVVLEVTAQLGKLQQLAFIEYSPAGGEHKWEL